MMFTRGSAAMITMFAAATVAFAEPYDAKEIFYSDSVLRSALEDIAQMQEAELRAFTHYLSECSDESLDASSRHACTAAQATYEIEFGNKRALDHLIFAKSTLSQLPPDVKMKDPTQEANAAIKYAKIISALEQAARGRFRSLKASQK
jgi:hypothetical protein